MTFEMAYVLAVAGLAVFLFVTEWLRMDKVAIGVPVLLFVGGIIDVDVALSGLSNPATVAVAGFMVLGIGLDKTGVIHGIGSWARHARFGSPWMRLVALCAIVAAISPFLSNTAVVVVFMPVFIAVAASAGHAPSRYLIPLSFTAILGGTVTLIGTSTNLIVHQIARNRGLDELSMFSIAPLGLIYLGVGLLYLLTIGRRLLPDRPRGDELGEKLSSRLYTTELRVTERSRSVGMPVDELDWRQRYGLTEARPLHRWFHWVPRSGGTLEPGDNVSVTGDAAAIFRCARAQRLETPRHARQRSIGGDEERLPVAELMVAPASRLIGRSLEETRFGTHYGAVVLAVQRARRPLSGRMSRERLAAGDLLLVQGTSDALTRLADDPAFIAVGEHPAHDEPRAGGLLAVAILVGVVASASIGVISIPGAAMVGAVVMLFSRCVRMDELYRELDWTVVALLAGLLPLGVALDETGTAALLGGELAGAMGSMSPALAIFLFYLITSVLTEMMSNQAAAVVLTPIAITTAQTLDMNPYALIVAVMFGCSASFMTPIGYQTNALIYVPGGYRFSDYMRVGGPLNLLLAVVASLAIPHFWP